MKAGNGVWVWACGRAAAPWAQELARGRCLHMGLHSQALG